MKFKTAAFEAYFAKLIPYSRNQNANDFNFLQKLRLEQPKQGSFKMISIESLDRLDKL